MTELEIQSVVALAHLRVLVVEDEVFVALEIEDRLRSMGCEVIGPIGDLESAMSAAESAEVDGAFLDINIRGGAVFPAACKLLARHVPVVLATGYAPETLPMPWRKLPCLRKPFSPQQFEAMAANVFGRSVEPQPDTEER